MKKEKNENRKERKWKRMKMEKNENEKKGIE